LRPWVELQLVRFGLRCRQVQFVLEAGLEIQRKWACPPPRFFIFGLAALQELGVQLDVCILGGICTKGDGKRDLKVSCWRTAVLKCISSMHLRGSLELVAHNLLWQLCSHRTDLLHFKTRRMWLRSSPEINGESRCCDLVHLSIVSVFKNRTGLRRRSPELLGDCDSSHLNQVKSMQHFESAFPHRADGLSLPVCCAPIIISLRDLRVSKVVSPKTKS
jgi:hypothetical protein